MGTFNSEQIFLTFSRPVETFSAQDIKMFHEKKIYIFQLIEIEKKYQNKL